MKTQVGFHLRFFMANRNYLLGMQPCDCSEWLAGIR